MNTRNLMVWFVILLTITGFLAGLATATEPPYKMGAILISPEEYSKLTGFKFIPVTEEVYEHLIEIAPNYPREPPISKEALLSVATPGPVPPDELPTAVTNSLYLPPVGDQGSVGSCNAWASTYYVWTYMINWFRNNPHPSTPDAIMNPSFTYNLINDGTDSGSIVQDAMNIISKIGAVAWDDFPVNTNDPSNVSYWPVEWQWRKAVLNRGVIDMDMSYWGIYFGGSETTGIIYVIDLSNETQFNYLKGLLAAGYVAETAIYVYDDFQDFNETNNIYALNQNHGNYVGGHAVTIVGYDDSKDTLDGTGAFLMVNSWGTGWGDHGYWWLTYQAAQDPNHELCYGYAYIFVPKEPQPYKPKILANVKITHPKRGEIIGGLYDPSTYYITRWAGIELGVGNPSSPYWSQRFFNFRIGYSDLASYQPYPFPDSSIVLDLTDSLDVLTEKVDSQYVSFYINLEDKYADGVTGTLDFFGILINSTYLHQWVEVDGPFGIPEDGNSLIVTVNVSVVDYTGITPLEGKVLNQNWVFIEIGSIVNITSAILHFNGSNYVMNSDSPYHFYYNVTGLGEGKYSYTVTVTFSNGNSVTLPSKTVKINTNLTESGSDISKFLELKDKKDVYLVVGSDALHASGVIPGYMAAMYFANIIGVKKSQYDSTVNSTELNSNSTLILMGGPAVNTLTAYYETIAPVKMRLSPTSIILQTPLQNYTWCYPWVEGRKWYNVTYGYFVIQVVQDPETGATIYMVYGTDADSTWAGAYYLAKIFNEGIQDQYQGIAYIVGKWTDTDNEIDQIFLKFTEQDNNGFSETDEITILEKG